MFRKSIFDIKEKFFGNKKALLMLAQARVKENCSGHYYPESSIPQVELLAYKIVSRSQSSKQNYELILDLFEHTAHVDKRHRILIDSLSAADLFALLKNWAHSEYQDIRWYVQGQVREPSPKLTPAMIEEIAKLEAAGPEVKYYSVGGGD
jgi:hypothetical protein